MPSARRGFLAALLVAAATLVPVPGRAAAGEVRRVSAAPAGVNAQGASTNAAVSADGRFVVFDSDAANLVALDTNGSPDVFVYDRGLGTVARVSVGAGGEQADSGSESNISSASPVSADGRFVAFSSVATNLVPGDENDRRDIFVRDRTAGTTTRVSVATGGAEADDDSVDPAISADGRVVVFESEATNLVPGDTNGVTDIFAHDRVTGVTTRASVATGGAEGSLPGFLPSVSGDGRYVTWYSFAFDLVPGDTNGAPDVFVHDRTTGATTRISVSTGGAEADAGSFNPVISADGRLVVFRSSASNLTSGDTNGVGDVFVRDLVAGTTTRVSLGAGGEEGNDVVLAPAISDDGRHVAFASPATNLVPGDTNARADVFVRDLQTGALRRVSVAPAAQAGGHSLGGSVANGGGFVAFDSLADNLIPGDTNAEWDVFVAEPDVTAPAVPAISSPANGSRPTTATVTVAGTAEAEAWVSLFDGGVRAGGTRAGSNGSWSAALTLIEGPHSLTAVATDLWGNSSPASPPRSFVVDLGPPVAPVIVSPPNGAALPSPMVTVSGTSEPATTVTITEGAATLATVATAAGGEWSVALTFSEGSHSIRARALDAADNLSPFTPLRTFAVDLTPPPAPTITVPGPGALSGAGGVTISGTAEPGATVSVSEGGTALGQATATGAGDWSLTASITVKGLHTIVAGARDAASNAGPPSAPRSFTVTTPAPVIATPEQARHLPAAAVTISGSAEPGASVEVRRVGGPVLGTPVASASGAWTLPATFGEGTHVVEAVATGTDGWVSPVSAPRSFTVDLTLPAAPIISAPAAGASLTSTDVTFMGTAEPFATVHVVEGAQAVAIAAAGSSGAWSVTKTLAPGSHTVVAVAEDRAGNRSLESAARTFTVSDLVKIVTPAAGSFQPSAVLITGTAPGTATRVHVYDDGFQIGSATIRSSAWSLDATFERGPHNLTARALIDGVLGSPTSVRSFIADAKPPAVTVFRPSGYVLFGVAPRPALVRGTAEEIDDYDSGVASVRVAYYDYFSGVLVAETANACASCPSGKVQWTDRPNLTTGLYRVRVTAVDVVGNVSADATMDLFVV